MNPTADKLQKASVAGLYEKLNSTPIELRGTQKLRAKASSQVLMFVLDEMRRDHELTDDDRDILDDWFIASAGWTLYGNAYDPSHVVEG